jgi:hypothetical protein
VTENFVKEGTVDTLSTEYSFLGHWCDEQRYGVMGRQGDVKTSCKDAQVCRRPHMVYACATRSQPRYVREVEFERRRVVVGVHNEYVYTFGRPAGIELWWIRGNGMGRCKRKCGFPDGIVLMEGDELRVRDDLDLIWAKRCELHMLFFSDVFTVRCIKIYAHRCHVKWDFS